MLQNHAAVKCFTEPEVYKLFIPRAVDFAKKNKICVVKYKIKLKKQIELNLHLF